jgi:transposase
MRGRRNPQASMLAFVDLEERVPPHHPLRVIRRFADRALAELSPTFDAMYGAAGRPSIPPERLLKASLLISLYSVRSERAFCEQLNYDLLWRWFLDMTLMEPSFDQSTFSKNRGRLLKHVVAQQFFDEIVRQAAAVGLLSDEHFTVDGTLIEAWASHKSFKRKDGGGELPPDDPGNPTIDFHGEQRSNATHRSTTDPEARRARKGPGKEAKLSYAGHVLMENRNGIAVNGQVTAANGRAEPQAAIAMVEQIPQWRRVTLGADKGYDSKDLVQELRDHQVTPHIACKSTSIIDDRTTRHAGYAISQQKRKRIEEIFGWLKTVASLRKTRHRGLARVGWMFTFALAAYNLVRMRNLVSAAA